MGVQGHCPVIGRHVPVDAKTDDLSQRVHSGVGPPGGDNGDGLLGDVLDRGFHRFLNGRLVELPLPAGVLGPLIFEREFDCRHRVRRYRGVLPRGRLAGGQERLDAAQQRVGDVTDEHILAQQVFLDRKSTRLNSSH